MFETVLFLYPAYMNAATGSLKVACGRGFVSSPTVMELGTSQLRFLVRDVAVVLSQGQAVHHAVPQSAGELSFGLAGGCL